MKYFHIILCILNFFLSYSNTLIELPITIDDNSHYPILFSKSSTETIIYLPEKKIILNTNTGIITSSYSLKSNYDSIVAWDENKNEKSVIFAWSKEVNIINFNDDDSINNELIYDYSNAINLNEEKSLNVFFINKTGNNLLLFSSYNKNIMEYYFNKNNVKNDSFYACDKNIDKK